MMLMTCFSELLHAVTPRVLQLEGLLLSCRGFWLFLDRLIGGGDKWGSKNHIEAGPQLWGLRVQDWTRTWNP
jgi:hypothetical protein